MMCLKLSQASATGWIAMHVQLNLTQLTNILELSALSLGSNPIFRSPHSSDVAPSMMTCPKLEQSSPMTCHMFESLLWALITYWRTYRENVEVKKPNLCWSWQQSF